MNNITILLNKDSLNMEKSKSFQKIDDECFVNVLFDSKFPEDNIFFQNEYCIIITDGVFLNLRDLIKEFKHNSLAEFIDFCYKNNKLSDLANKLIGSYCIIYYDKVTKDLCVVMDPWASKVYLFAKNDRFIIISNDIHNILSLYKDNNIKYNLNLIGAYSLITYAYMYDDNTLFSEVKRLKANSIYSFSYDDIKCNNYNRWTHERKINISMNEAIEAVDYYFNLAVEMQIHKNSTQEYINAIPLSAGLDSRMTTYVANRLKAKNILNFTYSQFGELDSIIPARITSELKHQWIFKNLDNGLDLFNIEQSIKLSNGLIYYPWVSQLNEFLKLVNTNNWGIVHTGVIGDVVLGTFIKNKELQNKSYMIGDGAYSLRLIHRMKELTQIDNYSYEEGMLLNRAINGACLGYTMPFRDYCENISPFMNTQFAHFCFSLPMAYRMDHTLYYRWIKYKYSEARRHKHNGIRINDDPVFTLLGKRFRISSLDFRLKEKFSKSYLGMNPFDYWLLYNLELRNYMDSFFTKNIDLLIDFPILHNDVLELYKTGTAIEKTMAISLIGSYKLFFAR